MLISIISKHSIKGLVGYYEAGKNAALKSQEEKKKEAEWVFEDI